MRTDCETVETDRLSLPVLEAAAVRALASGVSLTELGLRDPYDVFAEAPLVLDRRAEQLAASPADAPWLLRLLVEHRSGDVVGYVNFHAPPDDRGMVEIGYRVAASVRGRGYATEAATAMWRWAREQGARVLRATVGPDNVASLALLHRAGFWHVGEQMDEVDGLELVYERDA